MAPKPFDPNTAPIAGTSSAERAAINADLNALMLKLRQAGLQIYGNFRISNFVPYWNPLGFDFTCDSPDRLRKAASNARGLGFETGDMPGYDPWLAAGIISDGYTEIGRAPLVHLDIAVNRPGLCRLYRLDMTEERRRDAMQMAKMVTARDTAVFTTIYDRMRGLGIDLDNHIGSQLDAGRSPLDGINFVAKDHEALIKALTELRYPGSGNVFFAGSKSARDHLPANLSFLATEGIGFRQIWQTFPEERPGAPAAEAAGPGGVPGMNARFSARFGDSRNLPDLTSVHAAVSKRLCNFHIDEMGFVVTDASGNVIVDPDALRHIFVELLWKTDLQGKLPFWALDRINLMIPSSPTAYSRLGVSLDVAKFGRLNISLNGSCAIDGKKETAGTMVLEWRF